MNLTRIIVDLSLGAFFSIFIFRVTGSVFLTTIGFMVMYLGLFIGYLSTVFLIKHLHYYELAKFSFLLNALTYFGAVLLFEQLGTLIFPFLLIISISNGMYWTGKHLYDLHLFTSHELHPIWFKLYGFTQIFGVALPFLTGLLISSRGYDLVLLFAASVYFVGVMLPVKIKEGKRDLFEMKQLRKLMKHNNFTIFMGYTFIEHFIVVVRNFAFILTPFFFLGQNELELGLLTSAVAIASAVAAYLVRNMDDVKGYQLATLGAINFSIMNVLYTFFWNQGIMVFRSLIHPFAGAFFMPEMEDLQYKIKRSLLGKHVSEDAYELQIAQEVIFFVSRMLGALFFLFLLSLYGDYMSTARIIIAVSAIWPIIHIITRIRLKKYVDQRLE